jgi:hypothetical protein
MQTRSDFRAGEYVLTTAARQNKLSTRRGSDCRTPPIRWLANYWEWQRIQRFGFGEGHRDSRCNGQGWTQTSDACRSGLSTKRGKRFLEEISQIIAGPRNPEATSAEYRQAVELPELDAATDDVEIVGEIDDARSKTICRESTSNGNRNPPRG